MRIIPAIDLKGGQCVRLMRGEFDTASKVAEDAVDTARQFINSGAELIHMVDLDGAKTGESANLDLVRRVIGETGAKVELGGGMRSMDDLRRAFGLGVYRAVIGSAAVENPDFVAAAVKEYGDRVAVGIDAKNGRVRTRGWLDDSGIDCYEFASKMEKLGVSAVIFTDIDRDGMQEGPSFEALARMRRAVSCELVASGGVTTPGDVERLRDMGLDGTITGKAVYSGALDLKAAIGLARKEIEFDLSECFIKSPLIPAIVQDEDTRQVLMLGYANQKALELTLKTGTAWFWSRSRQKLWNKGETSGNFLHVSRVVTDCDMDTLLYIARPDGPTCHTGKVSCFFNIIK